MKISLGSNLFEDVKIPLLWGTRAILQDSRRRLSVIDLSGPVARLEIIAGRPASGVEFRPIIGGVKILENGHELYDFYPDQGRFVSIDLDLPDCDVTDSGIWIGSNVFENNAVARRGVGLVVDRDGIRFGGSLPAGLARMAV
jgi:hypothetical protein